MSGSAVRQCAAVLGFALASLAAVPAVAGPYYLDRFWGERNGSALFSDDFNDGSGPPNGGVYPGTATPLYTANRVVGSFAGAESNGKLQLDARGRGVQTINPFTLQPEGVYFTAAYLNLNTDALPANSARGLKLDHTFTIHGLFDLTPPPAAALGETYGIRLADFDNTTSSGWNDVLDLFIARSSTTGLARVFLFRRDLRLGTRDVLAFASLDFTQGDQIELAFTKDTAGDPTVQAQFRYVQGGNATGAFQVLGQSDLFNGEIFTRAGFYAAANAVTSVPEPAAAMLLLAAAAAAALTRRRSA